MNYALGKDVQFSIINKESGKVYDMCKIEISKFITQNPIPFVLNKETNITFNNVVMFRCELGKLYHMMIHVKSKRLKKKYKKLYNTKYRELMNQCFGV